jgi:hypothetical protein
MVNNGNNRGLFEVVELAVPLLENVRLLLYFLKLGNSGNEELLKGMFRKFKI